MDAGANGASSVGLVHDYLLVMRGAERTFAAIAECFPSAPIYTLLYDPEGTNGAFRDRVVRTSYLQRLGANQRNFRRMLPLFSRAADEDEIAFRLALERYCNGRADERTVALLEGQAG